MYVVINKTIIFLTILLFFNVSYFLNANPTQIFVPLYFYDIYYNMSNNLI